ncbi:MAG: Hsp70 family protein, partial [Saprospiraceae bacterium]
ANSTIPTKKSKVYSTAADNQPSVEIHILQGERPMARDNRSVGRFILDGIPPASRGIPQIEVTFDIDANGVLNVAAQDKGTGKKQNIRIEASTGLSKEEIEKMKNDAAINADNDKKTREKVDKLNEADSVIFQTEKQLKEIGDKIPEDKKTKINEALTALKTAHQSQDLDLVTKELEILNQAWAAASQDIYQAQQNGNPQQESATQDQQSNSGKPDDTVTDIEYEDVKK